jgi:hypothetical protein
MQKQWLGIACYSLETWCGAGTRTGSSVGVNGHSTGISPARGKNSIPESKNEIVLGYTLNQ